MHPTSLLVAALVMLRRPCAHNQAAASLLLARAAQHTALSLAEREACLCLVDELECEALSAPMTREAKSLHLPRS
jgi:hypothetical protein